MLERCKLCPDWLFCQMHGCTIWDADARKKYRREQFEDAGILVEFDEFGFVKAVEFPTVSRRTDGK